MSSDLMRLSGINSGYDTESMIEAMLTSYQTKIDTQSKKLTKLSWQQEAYRDVTTKLTDFKNKYFDILKKDNYLLSPTSFSKFKANVSTKSAGTAASGLKVTTTSSSLENDYRVQVDKLATASTVKGKTMEPASFALDLDKAASTSEYETVTDDSGTSRKYSFALDVQVGSVTKSVSFDVSVAEADDGSIDIDAFRQAAVDSLNKSLQESFGYSGRTGASVTGQTDDAGNEWFIQTKTDANGKLTFDVGGNASAVVTEKTGNFGLAVPAKSLTVSMGSVVTGTNSVSVNVNGVDKTVSFEGVSSTYYDSKDKSGNEAILKEYNQLKLEAYRKDNGLSSGAVVSQSALDNYSYSNAQAAKDKNNAAFTAALNSTFSEENVTFSIDGSTLRAKGSDGTYADVSMTVVSGGTLGLEKGTASNKYSAKTALSDMGIEADEDGKFSFEINGEKISLSKTATVNDLLSAVNKSKAGVTMTYSALTNSFDLTANDLGSAGTINIKGNDFTDKLGLTDGGSTVNYTRGENAVFSINGETIYHNANNYTIDGTTFSFEDDISLGETYTVGLSKNYDDIKQSIKDFVKDYNQLIDDIYGHIGTAPVRDEKNNLYEPLTDAQKEEMDDKDVEKWETAAKKGVIYNDSTVTMIMTKLRSALYGTVDGENGKFGLFSMGIKSSTDYTEHGKLEIDEDTFDAAFDKYADEITELFTGTNGIMKKVNEVIDGAVKTSGTTKGTLIKKAGLEKGNTATDNYIYRQMKSVKDRISTLQDRYDAKEEYWWSVFTNLESMTAKFNEQSSYLSSYFGGSY